MMTNEQTIELELLKIAAANYPGNPKQAVEAAETYKLFFRDIKEKDSR